MVQCLWTTSGSIIIIDSKISCVEEVSISKCERPFCHGTSIGRRCSCSHWCCSAVWKWSPAISVSADNRQRTTDIRKSICTSDGDVRSTQCQIIIYTIRINETVLSSNTNSRSCLKICKKNGNWTSACHWNNNSTSYYEFKSKLTYICIEEVVTKIPMEDM